MTPLGGGGGAQTSDLIDEDDPCPRGMNYKCSISGCSDRYFCTTAPCASCCSLCTDYGAFKDWCVACTTIPTHTASCTPGVTNSCRVLDASGNPVGGGLL